MPRAIEDVVLDVDALTTANPGNLDLGRLQSLVDEYFSLPEAPIYLDVWFRLFERFPESDGNEMFWSILHGIEAQRGSDQFVVASVRRKPTHFPVLMVNSILNAGVDTVGGVDLFGLLRSVTTDERASPRVRQDAERFLKYQHGRIK